MLEVKQRKFLDLSDNEIRQIVNDIFSPQKISCIKKSRKYDEITCKAYTEWTSYNDDGKEEVSVIPDEVVLRNPFDYGEGAIQAQFQLLAEDYNKLKAFCFSKGIFGASIKWLTDSLYPLDKNAWKKV